MESRSISTATTCLVALLTALLTACGKPPKLVKGGAFPSAAVPAGAPYFAGELRLTGDLAARTAGAVFVAVRPTGEGATLLVRKYDVGGPGFGPAQSGERTLRFELGPQNAMMAGGPPQFPPALQLWVFFDGDGSVDTKEDRISSMRSVELGDQDIRLQLPEG